MIKNIIMKKTAMNLLAATALPLLLLASACSTESRFEEPLNPDSPDKQTERREVMLTLNNKLNIKPAAGPRAAATATTNAATSAAADFKSAETNAETNAMVNVNGNTATARATIATAEENAIATLDVYVFGAAEENGNYTFQQRFSYRSDEVADASPIPANAEELLLTGNPDADQNVTTGLLSLKRGLFVKLYCVANNTTLINPATGNPMEDNEFTPIKFNDAATAAAGNPIAAAGVPTEKDFMKLHTALLNAAQPADTEGEVLLTPLSMSGAMTTPLDLTDNAATARLQTRLRLTRLAARFDIINEAEKSKFTIQSISMGNARRGTSYFPIAVKGDTPAKADEIITSAPRTFSSVTPAGGAAAPTDVPNANQGLSEGAFYAYPSPVDDKGYLILKGFYQVNKTEQKEVTYQVPFTQDSGNGAQTWLEINNNHRYTLAITKADDYHLDFTLNVADWEDDGNIDDYEPENKPGEIKIEIPAAFDDPDKTTDTYDPDRNIHTVKMSVDAGSTFDAIMESTSALTVTKTYAGGAMAQQNDWLEISAPVVTAAPSTYTYTFAPKAGYTLGYHPRATVRIFDGLSGNETILYVDALVKAGTMTMENSFSGKDEITDHDITLYMQTNGKAAGMEVKVVSVGGSTLTSDNEACVKVTKSPTVRNAGSVSQDALEAYYVLTAVAPGTANLTFSNATDPSITDTYTVEVAELGTRLSKRQTHVLASNDFDLITTLDITVSTTDICRAKVKDWNGGDQWFRFANYTDSYIQGKDKPLDIQQLATNDAATMKEVTVQIVNYNDMNEVFAEFTLTPDFPLVQKTSSFFLAKGEPVSGTQIVGISPYTIDEWEVTTTDNAVAPIVISKPDNTFSITPTKAGTATITVRHKTDNAMQVVQRTINVIEFIPHDSYGTSGYKIATKETEIRGPWSATFTEDHCHTRLGPNWYIPTNAEWCDMLETTADAEKASQEVFNYYMNGIFEIKQPCWSKLPKGSNGNAETLYISDTYMYALNTPSANYWWVRCVSK